MSISDKNPQLPQTSIIPQIDEVNDAPGRSLDHPSKEKYEFVIEDDSYPNSRVLEHAEQENKRNQEGDIERPDKDTEQERN
ncbi:hypothetical protein [Undibacterium pigrum]|uniref:Uncharacterized protein n=1 Tax=Undibacterium pigrum TaxID=401470 RepID=A0A318JR45_9BURK|nr:hypothetical protein [Undibacterium pigrum]PXX46810.1 hypothetical protein DFR42_101386 [Undibacterium pigrum]